MIVEIAVVGMIFILKEGSMVEMASIDKTVEIRIVGISVVEEEVVAVVVLTRIGTGVRVLVVEVGVVVVVGGMTLDRGLMDRVPVRAILGKMLGMIRMGGRGKGCSMLVMRGSC